VWQVRLIAHLFPHPLAHPSSPRTHIYSLCCSELCISQHYRILFRPLHKLMMITPPTHITLPSGDKMPTLGLGCWQSTPDQLISAIEHALKAGYRHIDGATIYGNEEALGEGVRRSGLRREDVWVTTKLWNSTSPSLTRSAWS
jgi:hypothetical protein